MAAAVAPRSQVHSSSFSVPVTQNTAPVLDFRCLFTSDIRRKQKRWQDGRLKFHAFNKRVIVFDDRGSKVGDTHFQEEYDFEEGEELELDSGGFLVQVGECVGRDVQDLSELLDKRIQEKEKRREARAAAAAVASPIETPARPVGPLSLSGVTPAAISWQVRPKSLNQVLGTPTGHHGKAALPTRSPFEERRWKAQHSEKENQDERPAKRRKPEPVPSRAGYAQNLTGATLNLSTPSNTPVFRSEPIRSRPIIKHRYPESIDLTNDEVEPADNLIHIPSHATLESSGIRVTKAQRKDRVTEKSKPEKTGYAGNLTGVALTLSGTYEKQRATGVRKSNASDDTSLPKTSRRRQRSIESEDVAVSVTRKSNPFLRNDDGFNEIGTLDDAIPKPRTKRASEFIRGDDDFVEIASNSAPISISKRIKATGVIDTSISERNSGKASNKRQKTSKPKSKSTTTTATPRRTSPVTLKEPANNSALHKPNDDASKSIAEDENVALRPLRIKARPPRKMLISAGRSNSRSSLEIPSKATEVTKSRSRPDDHLLPEGNLPTAPSDMDITRFEKEAILEAQTNGQWSTQNVFDDPPFPGNVKYANNVVPTEPVKSLHHVSRVNAPEIVGSAEVEDLAANSGRKPLRRAGVVEPRSSPEFEGLDYQAIDVLLSRNGNASPFAPKALREAIAKDASPLAPARTTERPPNEVKNAKAPTLSSKQTEPRQMRNVSCNTIVSRQEDPRETAASRPIFKQNESQQFEKAALLDQVSHKKDKRPLRDTIHVTPVIKESSSALAIPTLPIAIPPESIAHKPEEHHAVTPLRLNPKIIIPPDQDTGNDVLPNIEKTGVQLQPNIADTSEQLATSNDLPPLKKSVIPNPATRGKKAAQKTDAAGKAPILGPIFPHPAPAPMAPPPAPAPIKRANRVQNRVNSVSGGGESSRMMELAADEGGKGPWSKEAFDLFDWRPPHLRVNDADTTTNGN